MKESSGSLVQITTSQSYCDETTCRSGPSSIPSPVTTLFVSLVVGEGGISPSKCSVLLPSRVSGVLAASPGPGVLHAACAGEGVTLIKSLKLNPPTPGVAAPMPTKCAADPPGVDSIDEGSGVFCCGGVRGGWGVFVEGPGVRGLREGTAGDGEAAKNIRRSAASSLLREVLPLNGLDRRRALLATSGEGVRGRRGGEDRIWRFMALKEARGRSESSSSECDTDMSSSGIVASVTKERIGTVEGL